MKEEFKGIFSALLTAFGKDGDFCEEAQREMMRYERATGIAGFYVGGSTGEAFLLSPEERERLYTVCAEELGDKTGIAHIGALSTREAVRWAKLCESLGYKAVSSVTPFYYKFSTDEMIGYYRAIADAVDVPVLLYHIPVLTGGGYECRLFDELLRDGRVLGVKYTSSDYFTFERLRREYPDKMLYNGFDETCLCGLAMGADGAIGSTYNVLGERFVKLYSLVEDGDLKAAARLQHGLNDLIAFLLKAGDVKAAVKYVMKAKNGIDAGICRAPGGDVPEEWKREYEREYAERFAQGN